MQMKPEHPEHQDAEIEADILRPEPGSVDPSIWLDGLGGWHTQLLLRGFGLMLTLTFFGRLGYHNMDHFLAENPPSLVVLSACGISLALFGPRLLIMLAAACAGWDFIWRVAMGTAGKYFTMQAAEYPFFAVIPTLFIAAVCLAFGKSFIEGKDTWAQPNVLVEKLMVRAMRILALLSLFFVSFHKLNADFFNPSASCAVVLHRKVLENWNGELLPDLLSFSSPLLVVLVEGPLAIFLLLCAPRLGILLVTQFLAFVSLVNAIVVTLSIIIPTLAFLSSSDIYLIRSKWRSLLLVWLLISTIVLMFSHSHYQGSRPWLQYAIHQTVIVGILTVVSFCQFSAMRRWHLARRKGLFRQCRFAFVKMLGSAPKLGHHSRSGKALLIGVAFLWLANGLCPYFGIKFEYSFAMLSNLRVDDARWNHFIVPKWVRLTEHDPFIHLHDVTITEAPSKLRVEALSPSLLSPFAFRQRLEGLAKKNPQAKLRMQMLYRGESITFDCGVVDQKLTDFVGTLPQDHLFQAELTLRGPQACRH